MESPNHMVGVFFGLKDEEAFADGMRKSIRQVRNGGIYAGDNIFTFNRNLGFLQNQKLMDAVRKHANTATERAILWRQVVLAWAAQQGMKRDGDFVDCACYKGTTARILCEYLDFDKSDKRYYLYDLFEHDESMPHHAMEEHGADLYEKVLNRFKDFSNVTVTRGAVPGVLHDVAPEKIAFLHIDLNSAEAEIGALEILFDRMTPGAILVLDDYGWNFYYQQQRAEDAWFAARGYQVLELPTGQGLLIK